MSCSTCLCLEICHFLLFRRLQLVAFFCYQDNDMEILVHECQQACVHHHYNVTLIVGGENANRIKKPATE